MDPALADEVLASIPACFALGAIVGLVRFDSSTRECDSVWYHSGDFGWIVGNSIAFERSISNVKGCQSSFVSLNCKTHQNDKDRILKELKIKLEE